MSVSHAPGGQAPVKTPVRIPVKAPVKNVALQPEKFNTGTVPPSMSPLSVVAVNKEVSVAAKQMNTYNATVPPRKAVIMDSPVDSSTSSSDGSSSSGSSSDSDSSSSNVPTKKRTVRRKPVTKAPTRNKSVLNQDAPKRPRHYPVEDDESGDEEEKMSLLQLAQKRKLVDLTAPTEELEAQVEMKAKFVPKRPTRHNFPSDLANKLQKVDAMIAKIRADIRMKESGKEVSLSTSKVNYIDPRVVCSWCKRNDVPCTKIYSKSVLTKFPWAVGVEPDFMF